MEVENIIQLNHGAQAITYMDILTTIQSIADNNDIDLKECKQSPFKSVLREAQAVLFPRDSLKAVDRTSNKYDYELLDTIAECFINICQRYGKYPTPYAYSVFCGIPYDTLLNWNESDNLSDIKAFHIKKVINARNEAITDKLFDSNNVTGQAMLANNILGWNTSRSESRQTITENISTLANDFSSLGLSNVGSIAQHED